MRRYVIEWYAAGRWQRIGRTWWTRFGARRAAKRIRRNAVCHATKIMRLPREAARGRARSAKVVPIHHLGLPARLRASHGVTVNERTTQGEP